MITFCLISVSQCPNFFGVFGHIPSCTDGQQGKLTSWLLPGRHHHHPELTLLSAGCSQLCVWPLGWHKGGGQHWLHAHHLVPFWHDLHHQRPPWPAEGHGKEGHSLLSNLERSGKHQSEVFLNTCPFVDAGSSRDECSPECSDADGGCWGGGSTGHLQEIHCLCQNVSQSKLVFMTTQTLHISVQSWWSCSVDLPCAQKYYSLLMFACSKCGPRLSAAAAEKLKNRYVVMRSGAREHERESDKRPSIPITVRYLHIPSLTSCTSDMNTHLLLQLLTLEVIISLCSFQAAGGCRAYSRVLSQDEAAGCGWRGGGWWGPQTLPGVHTGRRNVWQPFRCVLLWLKPSGVSFWHTNIFGIWLCPLWSKHKWVWSKPVQEPRRFTDELACFFTAPPL